MLTIDGAHGEGGGQIVRSCLALSVVTGKPFRMENIRAGRAKPGLMRQHLAAVAAAAEISSAEVEGAQRGSRQLTFRPQYATPGDYQFQVGTAGSATLVLQTVLPALMLADAPSRLTLEGGTHNPWAPPFDFLAKAYLPLVRRLGPEISAQLERPGFYPAGGGRFSVTIEPVSRLSGFELLERGTPIGQRVRAIVSALPRHIAQRECDRIATKTDWPRKSFHVEEIADPQGPGNVVMIEIECQNVTEVFTGFGKIGVRAEQVADEVLRTARSYLRTDVPVGPYLADQLLLPLGISASMGNGGAFRTMALTRHSTTHIETLKQFLELEAEVQINDGNDCTVRIG